MKKLSEALKELRDSLALNQTDMGKKLKMSLKMYSLYETGKYDSDNTLSTKKLRNKIEAVKNELTISSEIKSLPDHDKEILRLQNIIAEKNIIIEDKNKHIAALEKIVMYQEGMILKVKKKVATIVHPKTRQS